MTHSFKPGDGKDRDFLLYFYAMFPMEYLLTIVKLTNNTMRRVFAGRRSDFKKITGGEIFQYYGV